MISEKLIESSTHKFVVEISLPVFTNIKKLAFQILHQNSSILKNLRFDLLKSLGSAHHIFDFLLFQQ